MKYGHGIGSLLVTCLGLVSLSAQTIDFIPVNKIQQNIQTGTSTVVADPTNPYTFEVNIGGSYSSNGAFPSGTNEISTIPGNASAHIGLNVPSSTESDWKYSQNFNSQGTMDAAFADGTYGLTIGGKSISLVLSGGLYPSAPVATVSAGTWVGGGSNILQLTLAEANAGLTITTSVFGSTSFSSGNSRIGVDVFGMDFSDNVQASPTLNSDTLMMNISGGSLTAGNNYNVNLEFNRIVDKVDVSGLFNSGATAVAVYSQSTGFQMQVIPEPSTYAVVLGAEALAGVMFHRRRKCI